MSIVLVLTVCAALSSGVEDCNSDIVEVYTSKLTMSQNLGDCFKDMDANIQTRDDRYLACTNVDSRYLIKRNDNRSVKQILADLNRD